MLIVFYDSMAENTKKERILKRNKRIRARFNEFINKKHFSVDYTLDLLAEEYALASGTVWLIVSKTGHYKNH